MKKSALFAVLVLSLGSSACVYQPEKVEAGHEGVQVDQPWFWGHEGVREEPRTVGTHWLWFTSKLVEYDIRPQRANEKFNDLLTQDNTPVDFRSYVVVEALPGRTPELHEKFGSHWYGNKVQEVFRTLCRDFARSQPLFELSTNPAVTTQGEETILEQLREYVDKEGIPVRIADVVIGGVTPPKPVLDETARTAAQDQRVRTESARTAAELSRKAAEKAKAEADLAYAEAFGLTADQFLEYRSLEIQREMVEVVKEKDNVSVIIGAGGGAALPTVRAN